MPDAPTADPSEAPCDPDSCVDGPPDEPPAAVLELAPQGCEPPADLGPEPLTMVHSDRPAGILAHYYDLALSADGDTLYAVGMPDLVIYDISDGALDRIGQYPKVPMPEQLYDSVAIIDDGLIAMVNGKMTAPSPFGSMVVSAALAVMDVSEPEAPVQVSVMALGEAAGVASRGDHLFVTDPDGQLVVVDVADPSQPVIIEMLAEFHVPRDIVIEGDYAYIADLLMGVVVVDISNAAAPEIVEVLNTAAAPQRLSVADGVLWVALGAAGFEGFDLADPAAPALLGGAVGSGSVAGLAAKDGMLWTAEHGSITAWDVTVPGHPKRLRSAVTPWYALDVLPVADGGVLVADWEDIERWQLGPDAEHPQLELASEDIVFVADTATTTFEIRNVGCTAMTVTGLEADVEGYDVLLADTEVAVGASIEATLVWTGVGEAPSASLCLATNDPGRSVATLDVAPVPAAFVPGPPIGSDAPDFVLPDLEGNLYSLADYAGQPVLIILFATWCPVCHFELPDIEATIWSEYRDQGLQVLAIGGQQESLGAVTEFREKYKLSFPILFDDSGVVLNAYRFVSSGGFGGAVPFPQDFVVSGDQTVVWRANLYDPQAIAAVIEAELPE